MPTTRKARQVILESFPTGAKTIYELGSGWGHLAFPIASRFSHAKVYAYELSPIPWLVSWAMQKIGKVDNLTIERKDFFQVSCAQADVVVCYLFPGAMVKLKEKFERELKEGAYVVTNSFAIPGWEPVQTIEARDVWRTKLMIYQKKKEAGNANLPENN